MDDTTPADPRSAEQLRADPEAETAHSGRPPRNPDDWAQFRTWPRPARWVVFGLVAVLVLLAAAAAGVFVVVRQSLPEAEGTLEVAGLVGEVGVMRDEHGIPQIYADSMDDLMLAQGYLHAQERFYEMDVRRHVTAGRLSELFGEDTLDTDRFIRTLGWRRVAEQEFALLRPETRRALESYAAGVNAYLADNPPRKVAVEYTLLGLTGLDYTPEPWEPADSLAWLKAMAWDLRGNMDDEVSRVLTTVGHTPEQAAELFPDYSYSNEPIVRQGAIVNGRFKADLSNSARRRPAFTPGQLDVLATTQQAAAALPELLGHGEGLGSNSWVVDGAHSATGSPILANDPHLGVSLPGIWMQMGLHCRTVGPDCPLQVAGFTFSGVPGVVIGHNAEIAWGFTNLGPDVSDLYVERVRGDTWRRGREWLPMETRTEEITVRGADPVSITIRQTTHGPLLSDASGDLADVAAPAAEQGLAPRRTEPDEEYAVSLAWTALEPTTTADAILALDMAGDWTEFRAAAADFAVPAQNMIYADRTGNIGYQAPGRIPIRQPGHDGSQPVPGWKKRFDWTGDYIPYAALPRVLNPAEGFIVTANQAVIGPDYPYLLTGDWDQGYRSQRIRELLRAEGELSMGEMLRLQLDDYNPMAPILTPYLLDIEDLPSGYYSDGQALLITWDFHQPSDSRAAAYYNATWRALLRLTFHDELPESEWPDGGARWFAAVEQLLLQPTNPWWDDRTTDDIETRDDILRQAQLDARDELTALLGRDPQTWSWGTLHQLDLRNATLGESGLAPVEWLENREDYQVGGGGSIVNATSWDAAEGYEVTAAPSMRMVVSLADFDDSRWINLTGVSGHPASGHYVDQTQLWVDGETLPWPFSDAAVTDASTAGLTLVPGTESP